MNKSKVFQALKIAVAAVLSVLAADFLGLKYAVNAGIITVLSIQNTKRETLRTARNRALAFLCALLLALICYKVLGFHIFAFSIFLFCFALVCLYRNWPEAIAVDSVLITHFLMEKSFSAELVWNEILLFSIGTGFGILFNLHLRKKEKEFERLSNLVDEEMKGIIRKILIYLQEDKEAYNAACFKRLEVKIEHAKTCALQNWNNTLWGSSTYEMNYIKMRENQSRVLQDIYENIKTIVSLPKQTRHIVYLLEKTEKEYHRNNDVKNLLEELQNMCTEMQEEKLPDTREEFEARAVLFYVLKQLDEFLTLKREFVLQNISEHEKRKV